MNNKNQKIEASFLSKKNFAIIKSIKSNQAMAPCLAAVFHVFKIRLCPLDISVNVMESLFCDTFEFLLAFIEYSLL